MENKCPACGTPLPSGSLAGLCPACLLQQAAAETATQPESPPFQAPTVAEVAALFPQLEIRSLLGKGGMGAVYMARQPALDRLVALKILPARPDTGADFADRFNREARALAKLNHPNIVTVHEFGQVNGQPYFIMEYVDGLNLRQLEQSGKLSPREALQIVPQICEALQFAHDAGIVHRDIKPDNILLDKKGRVKIADFGIAKLLGTPQDTAIPETQGAIGTPNYMAPEQIEKPQSVDHRADIFSLGVVFYEMLTGELPLGKFSPPSSGPRGLRVDVRLDEVVLRALEKEPDRRYQHASQIKTAVETIASTPPGAPPPPANPPTPPFAPQPPPRPDPATFLVRDYHLDIARCLSRGWALLKAHFWPLVGITALMLLLMAITDSIFARLGEIHTEPGHELYDGTPLLGLLLFGPLYGGLMLFFLKTMRGEPVTVETAFSGFGPRFLHLFLVHLVASFLIGLGFVCCILPGIYLLVSWSFALVLVMDQGLDFWPAMELSRKMVGKHWWLMLACLLLLGILAVSGMLACGIGLLLTIPVALASFLYAYVDVFGLANPPPPVASQPVPPPPIAKPAEAASTAAAAGPAGPTGPSGTVVLPPATPSIPTVSGSSGTGRKILLIVVGIVLILLAAMMAFMAMLLLGRAYAEPVHVLMFIPLLVVVAGVSLVGLLVIIWLLFRTKPELPGQPRTARGGAGRILAIILLSLAGVVVVALLFGGWFILDRHHRETRFFPVHVVQTRPPFMPTPPAMPAMPTMPAIPSIPAMPSAPIVPPDPTPAVAATTPALDALTERIRQELDHAGIRFNQLQVSSPSTNQLYVSLSSLQARDTTDSTNDAWHPIVGLLAGTSTSGGGWYFLGQGELGDIHFDVENLDVKQVLAEAATQASPAPASKEQLAERLAAAESITEINLKDKSLATLATEAATAGDADTVNSALQEMTQYPARDAASQRCALLLAKAGARQAALELAQGITDLKIHDETLAELAK